MLPLYFLSSSAVSLTLEGLLAPPQLLFIGMGAAICWGREQLCFVIGSTCEMICLPPRLSEQFLTKSWCLGALNQYYSICFILSSEGAWAGSLSISSSQTVFNIPLTFKNKSNSFLGIWNYCTDIQILANIDHPVQVLLLSKQKCLASVQRSAASGFTACKSLVL